jgi:hypothetical protein
MKEADRKYDEGVRKMEEIYQKEFGDKKLEDTKNGKFGYVSRMYKEIREKRGGQNTTEIDNLMDEIQNASDRRLDALQAKIKESHVRFKRTMEAEEAAKRLSKIEAPSEASLWSALSLVSTTNAVHSGFPSGYAHDTAEAMYGQVENKIEDIKRRLDMLRGLDRKGIERFVELLRESKAGQQKMALAEAYGNMGEEMFCRYQELMEARAIRLMNGEDIAETGALLLMASDDLRKASLCKKPFKTKVDAIERMLKEFGN